MSRGKGGCEPCGLGETEARPAALDILVGCEESGVLRRALRNRGHNAWSCDIEPAADSSNHHIRGDVRDQLRKGWDAAFFFTPCTRLANSGSKHLYFGMKKENGIDPVQWRAMEEGAALFNECLNADIPVKVSENPIQHCHARALIREYDQIVQLYWFGYREMKSTCLWIEGAPLLVKTDDVGPPPKDPAERRKWAKVHQMTPSTTRSRDRSRLNQGLADALADQIVGRPEQAADVAELRDAPLGGAST